MEAREYLVDFIIYNMKTHRFETKKIPEDAFPTKVAKSMVYAALETVWFCWRRGMLGYMLDSCCR